MEFDEAVKELENLKNWTVDWYSQDGITDAHLAQLCHVASAIQVLGVVADAMNEDEVTMSISILKSPIEASGFLISAALISAYQMGRASALGDEK